MMKSEPIIYTPSHIIHPTKFENPFLTVRDNNGYLYSERKGVDSVAFVLLSRNMTDKKRIGLINEFKPPLNKNIITAFGGSIDNVKYHNDLRVLIQNEAMEEAGFNVKLDDIFFLSKVFCSTQMNQFVYLFAVGVDKAKQQIRTTNDPLEKKSTVIWMPLSELSNLEDWKAPTIMVKVMKKRSTQAIVEKGILSTETPDTNENTKDSKDIHIEINGD